MKISPEQLKLYAVTDRSWLKPDETLASVTEELLRAGVSCVQLREKNASDEEILQEAALLKEICECYNVPLIINEREHTSRARQRHDHAVKLLGNLVDVSCKLFGHV